MLLYLVSRTTKSVKVVLIISILPLLLNFSSMLCSFSPLFLLPLTSFFCNLAIIGSKSALLIFPFSTFIT